MKHIPKRAVVTPFGHFEFPFVPFSLKTASRTFQPFMDFVFHGLGDQLIASSSLDEHIHHVRLVFECLVAHGLALRPEKCVFGRKVSFQGCHISAAGSKPERVRALQDFPQPKTTTKRPDLTCYLGLIHYYHRFIPKCAEQANLLNQLNSWSETKRQHPLDTRSSASLPRKLKHSGRSYSPYSTITQC